jgi:hypothetical protein
MVEIIVEVCVAIGVAAQVGGRIARQHLNHTGHPFVLSMRLVRVIVKPSLKAFTVHDISLPGFKSINFTTLSGIVVLSEFELGLATVTFVVNSPAITMIATRHILICLRIGRFIAWALYNTCR